jgi:hypothetical protein
MHRSGSKVLCRWALWLALSTIGFTTFSAAGAQTMSGPELVKHLQEGGYVLLMRHAHSPSAPPDRSGADPGNINLERQLDETGRSTVRAMGEAIRRLRIPVGAVLSSPTYRALETVHVGALGSVHTFTQLGDGGQDMNATAVSGAGKWLRDKVADRPKAKSNTIIVTQVPNIQTAIGKDAVNLTDGEALVFRPNGHGGADLVARVKIEDWPVLAAE